MIDSSYESIDIVADKVGMGLLSRTFAKTPESFVAIHHLDHTSAKLYASNAANQDPDDHAKFMPVHHGGFPV